MATLRHLKKEQQQLMPLFDGAFIENKPIPFPDKTGTKAYSNLFYWAHLVAYETAEFPLHPHEGFEIMTFVIKGSVEHYDTATKVYTPLNMGDMQVIQSGVGVKHAERIIKETELFQIWFDPDFSKTLKQDASYKDYPAALFKSEKKGGIEKVVYLGEKAPVYFETEGLGIEKLTFDAGEYVLKLDEKCTYSYYLLDGELRVNDEVMTKDDFLVINESNDIDFMVENEATIFVVKTPTDVAYSRFIERY